MTKKKKRDKQTKTLVRNAIKHNLNFDKRDAGKGSDATWELACAASGALLPATAHFSLDALPERQRAVVGERVAPFCVAVIAGQASFRWAHRLIVVCNSACAQIGVGAKCCAPSQLSQPPFIVREGSCSNFP
mgnify:CR=1 FL=1